ncbi:MAG: glycosyltransferase family 2 protein [Xanthomonadales bacterium PRO6]|nr:hypothetical protein [Xanthomonadales bacterium]MCE7930749.1 glycosyltransferase family 2 protein [Xanthomonadales bacterium PRO6]
MISVVILTKDEEINLPRCLASVAFSNDVVLVDSGSQDRTLEIARSAGVRVFTRSFDSFAKQRNFALEQELRNDWVLHLDADEAVTPELERELMEVVRSPMQFSAFQVASRLIFMGRWLKHAGMYPCYQVRFGRKDTLSFVDFGHGQRELVKHGKVGTLRAPLEHHNFSKGIADWSRRHLGYARTEAHLYAGVPDAIDFGGLISTDRVIRRRTLKNISLRIPFRPVLRFLYVYVAKLGFLDGLAGIRYAYLMCWYQLMIDLCVEEIQAQRLQKELR